MKPERKKSTAIRVACTEVEKLDTERLADEIGAASVSAYCLDAILDQNRRTERELLRSSVIGESVREAARKDTNK